MKQKLMKYNWPVVNNFRDFDKEFENFLFASREAKQKILKNLRIGNNDEYSRFLHTLLSDIYGYIFGYYDSPTYCKTNDNLEIQLQEAKIILEREMLDYWLNLSNIEKKIDQIEATQYLKRYIENNEGMNHSFFEFIETQMTKENFIEFLYFETIRDEVVDDEVGFILIGLQGEMKKAIARNLWDECGNGELDGFHTYWLRRLLDKANIISNFQDYRKNVPWFTKITSNSFNMYGTRSAYKYRAYGHFLITESWVHNHFEKIIKGLNRVGLVDEDTQVYFTKHYDLDPFHTADMLNAMEKQMPKLTETEIAELLIGAHTAVIAGTKLYDHSLRYFTDKHIAENSK